MRISDWSSDVCSSDLKRIEAKGKYETARRCRSFAGRVFRYAVATGRGESDTSSILRGALVVPKVKHHAAILDPSQMGELLRAIEDRQSVVSGKRVSGRLNRGGRRCIKKKKYSI